MAIVKANYVKRGVGDRGRAKATVRYIQDRPGKQKEKLTRTLFGSDGPLSREQVYRMIDEAGRGTLFYRLVISPDPNREDGLRDLNLANLTTQTIAELEDRLKTQILFAAVVHNDHAPHRHVHVLALLNRRLAKPDINFLRDRATAATGLQRRVLDLVQERSRSPEHKLTARPTRPQARVRIMSRTSAHSPAPPWRPKPACPSCSEGNGLPMRKISNNLHKCSSCGIIVRQSGLGMEIQERGGLGIELAFNDWL